MTKAELRPGMGTFTLTYNCGKVRRAVLAEALATGPDEDLIQTFQERYPLAVVTIEPAEALQANHAPRN